MPSLAKATTSSSSLHRNLPLPRTCGGLRPSSRVCRPSISTGERCHRANRGRTRREVVVVGLYRHELPRIPKTVLREAIANAVAHRTYENARQAIRIEIHRDRITVRSPGGLPEPVTIENREPPSAPDAENGGPRWRATKGRRITTRTWPRQPFGGRVIDTPTTCCRRLTRPSRLSTPG